MSMFIALVSLAACRSSRNVVEKTQTVAHTTVGNVIASDTIQSASAAHESQTDTAEVRADEQAHVLITRDSVGRVVEIHSTRSAKVNANTKRNSEHDRRFYGLNATRRSETSGSVDSIAEKEKETKEEVNAGIPWECIVGWSMVALLILFYAGDYIWRLWKRRMGR